MQIGAREKWAGKSRIETFYFQKVWFSSSEERNSRVCTVGVQETWEFGDLPP